MNRNGDGYLNPHTGKLLTKEQAEEWFANQGEACGGPSYHATLLVIATILAAFAMGAVVDRVWMYRDSNSKEAVSAAFTDVEIVDAAFERAWNPSGTPRRGYYGGNSPHWHRVFYSDQPRIYEPETITPEITPPGKSVPTYEEQVSNLKPKD